MDREKLSPWATGPDAPGVLIVGTPPASLGRNAAALTPQMVHVAAETASHDFSHKMREAVQRHMVTALNVEDLDAGQRATWDRVTGIWRATADHDATSFRNALHPRYTGWLENDGAPHDREAAIASVLNIEALMSYELVPKRIESHGADMTVVHYAFVAMLGAEDGPRHVEGRATEVYARDEDAELLFAATGGPTSLGT